MSYTLTESGQVMTETQDGITLPADYSFAVVNDYIHGVDVTYENLEALCLGMAGEIDKLKERYIANRDWRLAALEKLAIAEGRLVELRAEIEEYEQLLNRCKEVLK